MSVVDDQRVDDPSAKSRTPILIVPLAELVDRRRLATFRFGVLIAPRVPR